ncbi:MAG TPA: ATP synthase F1 subunit delta [Fimbriimonadaceae bacterium]|nr:ATP synthase F1 subunit delta [Fimbriimonadaceae bacterium]
MDVRVGRRYARALFNAARRLDVIESVEDDLNAISSLISGDERFRTFLYSPRVPREEKLRIAERLFSDRVTALTMQALRLLLEKRREDEFPAIRLEYISLRREHERVLYAVITSANELDQAQRAAIVDKLATKTGKRVEPEFKVDPHLMGGLKIAYENYVLDGTVKGSLVRLRDNLKRDLLKQV